MKTTNELDSIAKDKVCTVLQEIKQLYQGKTISEQKGVVIDIKEGRLNSQNLKRIILVLPSKGCSWALSQNGGCTMCGHLAGTSKGKPLPKNFFFKSFYKEYKNIDFSKYPLLCLYNSGSFLNDKELPPNDRIKIYATIRENKNIKGLIIESRPEYIVEEKIQELKRFLPNKHVEIGIGLESSNPKFNKLAVNKRFKLSEFRRAVALLKKNNISTLAYVLVKPPFITEKEAIDDAVKTAKFAFDTGADLVSLEPVSIQKFTLTEYLHLNGLFRPPWFWSVIEVVKRINHDSVRIGGFEYYPKPSLFMHNCPRCDNKAIGLIEEYNKSLDVNVFSSLECDCKKEWKKEIKLSEKIEPNLAKRIIQTLSKVDKRVTFKKMAKPERLNKKNLKCLICNKEVHSNHYCKSKKWASYFGCLDYSINYQEQKSNLLNQLILAEKKISNGKNTSLKDFSNFLPGKEFINEVVGNTPLIMARNYMKKDGVNIFLKNEGQSNPNKVFKDRESALVVSNCLNNKIKRVVVVSTGNAAASLSYYGNKAGIDTILLITEKTPKEKVERMLDNNSKVVVLRNSSIDDILKIAINSSKELEKYNIKNCTPGIDPLRREADKIIAFETFFQLKKVPDWFVCVCGNGSCLSGVLKGFKELKLLGLSSKIPKMVGVQIKGGDPIIQGIKLKQTKKPFIAKDPPKSFGDSAGASFDYFSAVNAVLDSKGVGVSVTDEEIARELVEFASAEPKLIHDFIPEPTGAEVFPGVKKLIKKGLVKRGETIVVLLSSHASNAKEDLENLLKKFKYAKAWQRIEKKLKKIKSKGNYANKSENLVHISNNKQELVKVIKNWYTT